MPKKILCAVDGSHASDRAAACAVELAKETGAKLTFVHVNTVPQDRIAKNRVLGRDPAVGRERPDPRTIGQRPKDRGQPRAGGFQQRRCEKQSGLFRDRFLCQGEGVRPYRHGNRSDERPGTALPRFGRHGSCIGGSLPRDDCSLRLTLGLAARAPGKQEGRLRRRSHAARVNARPTNTLIATPESMKAANQVPAPEAPPMPRI